MGVMKKRILVFLACLAVFANARSADEERLQMTIDMDYMKKDTSHKKESLLMHSIAPAFLFTLGSVYSDYQIAGRIGHEGEFYVNTPLSQFSDFVQYSPAALFAGTWLAFQIDGRQDWNDTKRIAFAAAVGTLTETALVNALKYTVQRKRPNGASTISFPSGHSATAFFLATMLHREYGETVSPWFSVAGYALAAGTGYMRVASNRHWVSDVLAGAGIGIFSGEFAWWLTDRVLGPKGLRPAPSDWPEDDFRWSFNFYTQYNFDRLNDSGDFRDGLRPGYTMGVQAERMFSDRLGVTLACDMTQIRWNGQGDIALPDMVDTPLLKSVYVGLVGDFPVYGSVHSFAELQAGAAFGAGYGYSDANHERFQVGYPSSFEARARLGLSIRTSRSSVIRCYAGAWQYAGYGFMFSAGSSVNLTF